ncbi:unnamed protein product, partial [Rotaria sp. Silwood2]
MKCIEDEIFRSKWLGVNSTNEYRQSDHATKRHYITDIFHPILQYFRFFSLHSCGLCDL